MDFIRRLLSYKLHGTDSQTEGRRIVNKSTPSGTSLPSGVVNFRVDGFQKFQLRLGEEKKEEERKKKKKPQDENIMFILYSIGRP